MFKKKGNSCMYHHFVGIGDDKVYAVLVELQFHVGWTFQKWLKS